jgi:hypothetical protein
MGAMKTSSMNESPASLPVLVRRWAAAGLISDDQAERILAVESAVPAAQSVRPAPSRLPLVAEALGYLGGALVLAAVLTLAARYWSGFGLAGRLAFAGSAMVVLFAGGVVLPESLGTARDRARSVLEALSTGAFAAFTAVLADEGFGWEPRDIALFSSGCAAGYAGGLWLHRRDALLQVVLFASSAVAAGTATIRLEHGEELVGLAVWGLAAVWLLLSWGGLLQPRRAGYLAGGAGAVFGAQAAMVAGWGYGLAVAAAVALVVAAVLTRDVALLVISAVGMFLVVPATVDHFFPDQLSVSFALLVTGMLLLAGGALVARRRARPRPGTGRDLTTGPAGGALVAAAVIAAGVIAWVLGVGGPWAG